MLIVTHWFAQLAALICTMAVSCFNTQQIVYYPVDVPSSLCKSGLKSFSCWLSWTYASSLNNWALGREPGEYTYPSHKLSISEHFATSLSLCAAGGVTDGECLGSGVYCLYQSGGGAPIPLHLHCICGFTTMPFWQGRQVSMWFAWSIARYLSIVASTLWCPGISTLNIFLSWTSAWGFLICCCISSIAALEHPPWTFWPYSRQGTGQTVLAVLNLLALP